MQKSPHCHNELCLLDEVWFKINRLNLSIRISERIKILIIWTEISLWKSSLVKENGNLEEDRFCDGRMGDGMEWRFEYSELDCKRTNTTTQLLLSATILMFINVFVYSMIKDCSNLCV